MEHRPNGEQVATTKAARPSAPLGWALAGALIFSGAPAFAEDYYSPGFTLCKIPFRPPCATAKLKAKQAAACEDDMQAYVLSVFRYRACQEAATERAVRDANDYIDAWKCKRGEKDCLK